MLWEDVLKTTEKYTDDTIVLAMIRNWLITFSIFNIFGIIIDRKFKLNITRSETDTELRTEFNISVGRWIFKRTFSISDVTKKKKKESLEFEASEVKLTPDKTSEGHWWAMEWK